MPLAQRRTGDTGRQRARLVDNIVAGRRVEALESRVGGPKRN